MCNFCSKQFFYIASVKKHAQISHPDICSQIGKKSLILCTTLKKQSDQVKPLSEKIFPSRDEAPEQPIPEEPAKTGQKQLNITIEDVKSILSTQSIFSPMLLPESEKQSKTEKIIKEQPSLLSEAINPSDHLHVHLDSCGHVKIRHNDHIDYLHDGELHNVSDTGWTDFSLYFV